MLLWILTVANVAVTLLAVARMTRFVAAHPAIDSRRRLLAYQRFVATQMWATLFLMATVLAIPLVMIADAVMSGTAAANWWPVALMSVPLLFRSRIRETEKRCRSLPASPELAAAYDRINAIWVDKALPRFAEHASAVETGTTAHVNCRVHGDACSATICPRCGAYQCIACRSSRERGTAICDTCAEHFRKIRMQQRGAERRSKIAGYMAMSAGLVELIWAGLLISDSELRELLPVGVLLFVLGLVTFVGATLWEWYLDLGRRLTVACAAIHVLLAPVGTVIGLFVLVTGMRYASITSPAYAEVRRLTGPDRLSTVVIGVTLSVAVISLYGANLTGLGFALMMLAAR